MCPIAPVRSVNGQVYFVEKDLGTKHHHVVALSITYNKKAKKWENERHRVYGTSEEISFLQLVRRQQMSDQEHLQRNYDGVGEQLSQDQLWVATANLNLVLIEHTDG